MGIDMPCICAGAAGAVPDRTVAVAAAVAAALPSMTAATIIARVILIAFSFAHLQK
jgi:hypothetical protein